MIKLTRTSGKVIIINPRYIVLIDEGVDGSKIQLNGSMYYTEVKETIEQIYKAIEND